MFSRLFAAKVRFITLGITRKSGDEETAVCTVTLQYDFTDDLAEAIGGAAPQIKSTLTAEVGDSVRMTRAGMVLDTKEVAITMKAADKTGLKVERTSKLQARVRKANAEETGPMLEAKAAFRIDDDDAVSFLRRNLGQMVKVRLDRRQLEFAAAATTTVEDDAVEAEFQDVVKPAVRKKAEKSEAAVIPG